MFWTIILWLSIGYVAIVVLWRLFIAAMMIVEGYAEEGGKGAFAAAALNFVINLWDFGKFAFTVLILVLIIRSCREDRPRYSEDYPSIDKYLTTFGIISNETRHYAQTFVDLRKKYQSHITPSLATEHQKDYRSLLEKGKYILATANGFDSICSAAKVSIKAEVKLNHEDAEVKRMLDLLLEQIDVGKHIVNKAVQLVSVGNEMAQTALTLAEGSLSIEDQFNLTLSSLQKAQLASTISTEINDASHKFNDLNYERLKISNRLKQAQNGN